MMYTMKLLKYLYFSALFLLLPAGVVMSAHAQAQVYVRGQWITINSQTLSTLEDYRENPANMEFSKYGGWKARRTSATGYFRVEKIDGRWWAIDPEGYYYIHKALNSVKLNDLSRDEIYQTLTKHGFNGFGNWTDERILESSLKGQTPLAYCPGISFVGNYRRERPVRIEMPIFDDEFESYCNNLAQYFVQYEGDPHVFGYFSDNELSWVHEGLRAHLKIPDSKDENHITAINFLKERGKTENNWDTEDESAYVALMGERYYSVVSKAIKAVSPDHLYLGTRSNSSERRNEAFMRNAGKYVDVYSTNHYSKWGAREYEIQNMVKWAGKPIMITEFYSMEIAPDKAITGAGHRVIDQKSRGLFYQNFVSTLAETGAVVGYHWFKFQDDGNGNKGVVDQDGKLYAELLESMEELNTRIYDFIDYADSREKPMLRLDAEADAYYQGDTNFNTEEMLVKKSRVNHMLREAYLRFDLASVPANAGAAEIKVFSIAGGSAISNYQAELVTDDDWDESTLALSNRTEGSKVLATWSDGGDVTIDVTDEIREAIEGNRKLSIRIVATLGNGNAANYASSEHHDLTVRPKLLVYAAEQN